MDIKELDQTIKVGVIFSAKGGSASGGKGDSIIPKWFIWEGRKYEVKELNYAWSDRQGREKLHCFSVTDGVNNYELAFHSEKTVWKLTKVFGGG